MEELLLRRINAAAALRAIPRSPGVVLFFHSDVKPLGPDEDARAALDQHQRGIGLGDVIAYTRHFLKGSVRRLMCCIARVNTVHLTVYIFLDDGHPMPPVLEPQFHNRVSFEFATSHHPDRSPHRFSRDPRFISLPSSSQPACIIVLVGISGDGERRLYILQFIYFTVDYRGFPFPPDPRDVEGRPIGPAPSFYPFVHDEVCSKSDAGEAWEARRWFFLGLLNPGMGLRFSGSTWQGQRGWDEIAIEDPGGDEAAGSRGTEWICIRIQERGANRV
ncbi:hypothetical protein N7532_001627 [Penicillium argentinense]|uniref:Uncharacterized protein n=1 Tax=Penicillium argentinense TaxID=1131581 RepID=A0A9W9KMN8_9EURO|nr:uncharacterized protein N7532_001627 [Penicillium argentinense]KAJ5111092.1 hypothetical protein N7532_001627 [Penicillium argentinense]